MIFDHEPTRDDWAKLGEMFNVMLLGGARSYVEAEHAYWVKVTGASRDDLMVMEGVVDVLALRVVETGPEEGETDLAEQLAWAIMARAAVVASRVRRL